MFRNVRNKKFTDVVTNDILTVNEQIENIAVLDNGQRVDVNRLLNPMYFDEYIDPNQFFNTNTFNIFAEKIKSIPNDIVDKLPQNDSAIIANYDVEEEKKMVAEKYNIQQNNQGQISAQRQLELLKNIVGEEEYSNDELTKMINPNITPTPQKITYNAPPQEETIIRINVEDSDEIKQEIVTIPTEKIKREINQDSNPIKQELKEDPITTIFKNVKKNTDFSFTLDIVEKIPRLDFLEMMEDSYEVSIIDYLAEEFTKKIINEPTLLKDKIANEIRLLIENKDTSKKNSIVEDKSDDILPKVIKQPIKKAAVKRKIAKTEEKNNI
jgi:hypothetical protein